MIHSGHHPAVEALRLKSRPVPLRNPVLPERTVPCPVSNWLTSFQNLILRSSLLISLLIICVRAHLSFHCLRFWKSTAKNSWSLIFVPQTSLCCRLHLFFSGLNVSFRLYFFQNGYLLFEKKRFWTRQNSRLVHLPHLNFIICFLRRDIINSFYRRSRSCILLPLLCRQHYRLWFLFFKF